VLRNCAPSSHLRQVNDGHGSLSNRPRRPLILLPIPVQELSTSPAPFCSARPACSSSSNFCKTSKMSSKHASSSIIADMDLAQRLRASPSSSIPSIFLLIYFSHHFISCIFVMYVLRYDFESNMQNGRQDQSPVIHIEAATTRTGPMSQSTCSMLSTGCSVSHTSAGLSL
jgi:hypothetical protein